MVKLESQGFEVTETEMYEKFKIKIHPRLTGFANGTLLRDVSTRLIGQHQQDNIKAAIEAAFELKKQGWDVRDKGIRRALQNLYLPGRLNVINYKIKLKLKMMNLRYLEKIKKKIGILSTVPILKIQLRLYLTLL